MRLCTRGCVVYTIRDTRYNVMYRLGCVHETRSVYSRLIVLQIRVKYFSMDIVTEKSFNNCFVKLSHIMMMMMMMMRRRRIEGNDGLILEHWTEGYWIYHNSIDGSAILYYLTLLGLNFCQISTFGNWFCHVIHFHIPYVCTCHCPIYIYIPFMKPARPNYRNATDTIYIKIIYI